MKTTFKPFFDEENADIFAIQETKMQEEQKEFDFPGYFEYWNCADKKGYSGTLCYTKQKPLSVIYGLEDGKYNDEGRVITLEFEKYYFVNAYVPNSKEDLSRIPYRMIFEDDMRLHLKTLERNKPVIYCGDLNVAHREIDIKNPRSNERSAGFTIEEREKMSALLNSGFIDIFRHLYPSKIQYTWWSYMFQSRMKNIGWRIDYFVISDVLARRVKDCIIHDDILGSDHCPIELDIDI